MKNQPFFFHGTTLDDRRFTVAGTVENVDDLVLGISICGPDDHFVKSVGRDKAEGRLMARREVGRTVIPIHDRGIIRETFKVIRERPTYREIVDKFTDTCVEFSSIKARDLIKSFNLRRDETEK